MSVQDRSPRTATTVTTTTTTTTTTEGHYWYRRPAGVLPWALGAAGLLGLGVAHDLPVRHSIENDLETRSRAALTAANAPDVKVNFTGMDGELTGTLPPGVSADELVAKVKALNGVRVVKANFGGDPAGAGSGTDAGAGAGVGQLPDVGITTNGGKVTLTGKLPNQADIDSVVAAANAKFGAGNVTNQLTVDNSLTIGDAAVPGLTGLIGALDPNGNVTASLAGGKLNLDGTVPTDAVKTALETAGGTLAGASGLTSNLSVSGGSASAGAGVGQLPDIGITTNGGKVTLTGKLPSQADIDSVVAAANAKFGAGNVTNQLTVDNSLTIGDAAVPGLTGLIGALDPNGNVTASLAGGKLNLDGTVPTDAVRTALEAAAAGLTGASASVASNLNVGGTGATSGATPGASAGASPGASTGTAPTSTPGAGTSPSPGASGGSGTEAGTAPSAADKAAVQAKLNALPRITFRTGSSTLTTQGMAITRQVAAILKANPNVRVQIQGHTDDIGGAALNRNLSTVRARQVRQTLVSLGVGAAQMSSMGYGESRPAVPNTSATNREINRRVQFQVS